MGESQRGKKGKGEKCKKGYGVLTAEEEITTRKPKKSSRLSGEFLSRSAEREFLE